MSNKLQSEQIRGIYGRVREAFKEKAGGEVTDSYIAERLGIDRTIPGKWKKGKGPKPQVADLIKASEETGYSLHYIVRGEGPKKASEAIDTDRLKQRAVRDFLVEQLNVYSIGNGDSEKVSQKRKVR